MEQDPVHLRGSENDQKNQQSENSRRKKHWIPETVQNLKKQSTAEDVAISLKNNVCVEYDNEHGRGVSEGSGQGFQRIIQTSPLVCNHYAKLTFKND